MSRNKRPSSRTAVRNGGLKRKGVRCTILLLAFVLLHVGPAQAGPVRPELGIESVFVRDMSMSDFAELLTRSFGSEFRVLVSDQAGEKRITFYLADTEAEDMLRALCSAHGLWYRRSAESGIVQIMTLDEYRQGINLYADESVEVVPILYPAPEEIGETLARLFQDRVVWDPPPHALGDDIARIERALNRMDTIADRATLVDGGRAGARDLGTGIDRRRDGLRNRRTETTRREDRVSRSGESRSLDEVLARQQRELEAHLERARRTDEAPETLGERPGLVYVSSSPVANALVLRSSDAASLALVKRVAGELDRPRPQVLLEVKVLDILLDDDQARGVDWLFQHSRGSDSVSGGAARGITPEPGRQILPSDPDTLVPQGTGIDPLAAVFSYVSGNVRARIQMLEDENRIRSLAEPSLLVADNEASRIFIGSEVTVLERVEPETETFGEFGEQTRTVFSVTAPRKRIGTTLLITPKIHADRTVTIRILQEETQLGPERTVRYGKTDNDQFTAQDVEERSVTSTILAADGHKVAIGGLIRERESERRTGVPVLMNIPLVGGLFRRTIQSKSQSELLVLIRPHVLLAPGEDAPVYPSRADWSELGTFDFRSPNAPSAPQAAPAP